MNKPRPAVIFLILTVAGALLVTGYITHVKRRGQAQLATPAAVEPVVHDEVTDSPTPDAASAPPSAGEPQDSAATSVPAVAPEPPPAPRPLFYRHTGVDGHYGKVAWVDAASRSAAHFVDDLLCEVVYASGGHGICLSADRGVFTTYAATLFDTRTLKKSVTFPLNGIPSRARVSIDGSLAAFTVFVSGHGYTTLDFSTQTLLIEVASGETLADLETFEVRRDGEIIKAADFNFWGVTFTPDARQFYATLSTDGKHFLVRGDIAGRTAEVIHDNVECPSLSPDARRVAYKKRLIVDNRIVWQLHVLDIASGRETALSERRSIDDQLEWLDDAHVLYSVPSKDDGSSPSTDVWVAPADARRKPRLFLRNAYSPAVTRCATAADCAPPG